MKLRDYQKDIVEKVCEKILKDKKCLVTLPTGGGKTVIFCSIIKKLKLRSLIICHTAEIKQQIEKMVYILDITDLVDVATIQSLYKRKTISQYDLLVIDECHHACAASYKKIISQYKDSLLLGVTATPFRSDKKSLIDIFGLSLFSISVFELINMGFLCDIVGYSYKTDIKLPNPNGRDFSSKQLSAVIDVKNRNELIVNSYKEKFSTPVPTICFASSLNHALSLNKVFKENGIKSDVIHGQLHKSVREKILDDFKNKELNVILNYNILTEGFDEPIVECLIMARPTLSKGLYIQMIGRGLRTYPSKEYCTVLEYTDSEYDVCDLRDLFNFPRKHILMEPGKKLSRIHNKIKPELLEGNGIIEEKVKLFTDPRKRLITEGQKSILESLGIKTQKSMTYMEAETIIMSNYRE